MLLPEINTTDFDLDPSELDGYWSEIQAALLIRRTEQRLLDLFAEGLLFGTVHTSIGQEFVGVSVCRALKEHDSVFSNHRGHGHYLARFGDVSGLIAEVMGKSTGVCAGRGGSQHLQRDTYYSNGIQGGIVPVATGIGFAEKLKRSNAISVVFIGDGTLGQGATYESMNIASKWSLPVLFVCENNFFAQSTSQAQTLAGDICSRAAAFDIDTIHESTWDWKSLLDAMQSAVAKVRETERPMFARVDTFRLMAHSKGDDNRPAEYVDKYWSMDPLQRLEKALGETPTWQEMISAIDKKIEQAVEDAKGAAFGEYAPAAEVTCGGTTWQVETFDRERVVTAINRGLTEAMHADQRIVIIGEDIESPYGGAFKCTKGLSTEFPSRVRNTPISELAIAGIGNGMALAGMIPVVEFMFGDFLTLAMDQWVNHAAKFKYMFNEKVSMPVVFRTPMGGKRGYASTHSQSIEKHFLGLPDTQVFCLHHRMDAGGFYKRLLASIDRPTLVIENKLLYGTFADSESPDGFQLEFTGESPGMTGRLRPAVDADLTIVSIGGMSTDAEKALHALFVDHEIVAELLLPTQLYPFYMAPVIDSVARTGRLLVVEEGLGFASISSEIITQAVEAGAQAKCARVNSAPTPIPASRPLEAECLPGVDHIVSAAVKLVQA